MRLTRFTLVSLALVALVGVVSANVQEKRLKLRIAVAPLDWSNKGAVDNWTVPVEFRQAIYEKLVQKLVATNRFVVLEREALDVLLQEKAIKEETTGQDQKGKITPAQVLVKGQLTDFELQSKGGGGGVSIGGSLGGVRLGGKVSEAKVGMNVRMFDVDTSEVIATESASKSVQAKGFTIGGWVNSVGADFGAFEKTPLGEATTKALDEAVEKIVKALGKQPWQAMVADFDDKEKEVTINAGSDLGVREGDVFDVYKVTRVIKDPETGAILGKKTAKIGSVKVTSVEKKFAVARVLDGEGFETGAIVREIQP
jgi:curli biogenesis system outer membrane secretion channel CsgG